MMQYPGDATRTEQSRAGGVSGGSTGSGKPRRRLPQIDAALTFLRNSTYAGLILIVGGLIIYFVLTQPLFSDGDNLQNLARQGAALAILAAGQTFVILIGGIDISVGAQVSLASIMAVTFAESLPVPAAFALAALVGIVVGLINGGLVSRARISPIVATVATWQLLIGFNLIYTNSQPKQNFSETYRWLGSSEIGFLATPTILAVAVVGAAWLVLNRTRFGRYIYAIGGNREAARLSGINVRGVELSAYVVCAFCAAIAGLVLSSRVGSGTADLGSGIEITTIAAVFIGGVVWGGGAGSVIGVVLGVVLLTVLSNGLALAGTDSNYQILITGMLMLAAVALNNLRRRDVSDA